MKRVADRFLRSGYEVIDTVGEGEDQTHIHVPQQILVVDVLDQMRVLTALIEEQLQQPQYKVMVFSCTAMQTAYLAKAFVSAGVDVFEMHSRKTQSYRTRTSQQFREAKNAIMFTSDVTAR